MKTRAGDFLANLQNEIRYCLRQLCGKPSPMKRLIAVLLIGGALAVANIYFLVSAIYNIGRRDAEIEFIKLQYEMLKLQQKENSINILEQHEYDRQLSDGRE